MEKDELRQVLLPKSRYAFSAWYTQGTVQQHIHATTAPDHGTDDEDDDNEIKKQTILVNSVFEIPITLYIMSTSSVVII